MNDSDTLAKTYATASRAALMGDTAKAFVYGLKAISSNLKGVLNEYITFEDVTEGDLIIYSHEEDGDKTGMGIVYKKTEYSIEVGEDTIYKDKPYDFYLISAGNEVPEEEDEDEDYSDWDDPEVTEL